MIKVIVLYGHPVDAAAFEKYYRDVHTPITRKIPNLDRLELTTLLPGMDGGKPPYYRMTELYFATAEIMMAAFNSPEGKAAGDDLANFATGGATFTAGVWQHVLPA